MKYWLTDLKSAIVFTKVIGSEWSERSLQYIALRNLQLQLSLYPWHPCVLQIR